jgi:hypothetical protein
MRLDWNARRKLPSAATSAYHCKVKPAGRSVFIHTPPSEPTTRSAIGAIR